MTVGSTDDPLRPSPSTGPFRVVAAPPGVEFVAETVQVGLDH